jgi:hypothetical protein
MAFDKLRLSGYWFFPKATTPLRLSLSKPARYLSASEP